MVYELQDAQRIKTMDIKNFRWRLEGGSKYVNKKRYNHNVSDATVLKQATLTQSDNRLVKNDRY